MRALGLGLLMLVLTGCVGAWGPDVPRPVVVAPAPVYVAPPPPVGIGDIPPAALGAADTARVLDGEA